MEALKLHRKIFFRKIQTDSMQKFLNERRQEIMQRKEQENQEVIEYDFEFNDQLKNLLKLIEQSMHVSSRLTHCLDSLEKFAEFLQNNFELLLYNQQTLIDARIWDILLPPQDCIFINSLPFCLSLLDILVMIVYISPKIADLFAQHGLIGFLRQNLSHKEDQNIQEACILILTALLYRDQSYIFPVFMELVDEGNRFKSLLSRVQPSNVTHLESLCLYLEGLVQVLNDPAHKKRAYSFLLYLAELDIVDSFLVRLFRTILFCWKNDNSLIPSLIEHPFLLERLVQIIENSREEFLLTVTYSILGNFVGYFDQSQAKDLCVDYVFRPPWMMKLYQACVKFLANTHHKIPAQAKCLFLLYNTIETCKVLNNRENFIKIFELFLMKGPAYELRNSVDCAEEILKLVKLILERSKIEQQIELVSMNLGALDFLFGFLVHFSQADISLYSLHNIIIFLNIDKVIELKLGQSVVREYITEKNLLSRLEKSFKHPDNRVKSLASYLFREYFAE